MNRFLLAVLPAVGLAVAANAPKTYTGTVTDSMCLMNHAPMKISPDSKCARECVKNNKDVKFVLHAGNTTYKLSDQQTPEQFAGQKVKVTGVLFPKIRVIKVDKIEVAK